MTLPQAIAVKTYGLPAYTNIALPLLNILLLLAILTAVILLQPEDTLSRLSFSLISLSCILQLCNCYLARRNRQEALAKPTDLTLENGEKGPKSDVRELDQEKQV